jgi:hypothetical protein
MIFILNKRGVNLGEYVTFQMILLQQNKKGESQGKNVTLEQ